MTERASETIGISVTHRTPAGKMPVDAGSVSDAEIRTDAAVTQEAVPSVTTLQATPPLHSIPLCFSTDTPSGLHRTCL